MVNQSYAEMVTAHLNPLPRSVKRTGAFVLLDGTWSFELDLLDKGLEEEWFKGHKYSDTIEWPSSIEAVMDRTAETLGADSPYSDAPLDMLVGWYEREFTIPEDWLKDPAYIAQVTFGACGYETRVWLNGRPLKTVEGEDVHEGEFTSFSYELPTELLQPVNRFTVRTADTLDEHIPRGKQQSRVFKQGGIWYQTISGPVRSIWIEPVLRNRLRSRLGIISTIEDGLVEFIMNIRVHEEGNYTLTLEVEPRTQETTPEQEQGESIRKSSNDRVIRDQVDLYLEEGDHEQRLVLEIPDAKLWDPDHPNLYRLRGELEGPDGAVSVVYVNFGVRKIEARGRYIYFNDRKLYLDGILYQPHTATFEQITQHMHAMQDLGCNMVRVHIAGIDPRIYDLADQLGIILWVEVPSPHTSSARSRELHWAELHRMLRVIASHPSVCILSLYNEDWGAQDVATNEETRKYISDTFAYMRVNYPQLLIVDNDGWRHTSTDGRLESHLMTVHMYTDDLGNWDRNLDRVVAPGAEAYQVHIGDWRMDLVVGDPFFYRGQVPVLVSEWGGFGWSGYAGPQDAERKGALIRDFKRAMRRRPIAGDVYTQATSIEEEVNGLIDPETGELLVKKGILRSRQQPFSSSDS